MTTINNLVLLHDNVPLGKFLGIRINRFDTTKVTIEFADREPLETDVSRVTVQLVPVVPVRGLSKVPADLAVCSMVSACHTHHCYHYAPHEHDDTCHQACSKHLGARCVPVEPQATER